MISPDAINDIAVLYTKHGWQLRRILLTEANRDAVVPSNFAEAKVEIGELNAIWFSRRSAPEQEAWELRRLTGSAFALVEVIPDSLTEDEREYVLKEVESKMSGAAVNSGH